jgi:hypothetical protein
MAETIRPANGFAQGDPLTVHSIRWAAESHHDHDRTRSYIH